jgi:predicted O-methyltransferase YrrM
METKLWTDVDRFFEDTVLSKDPILTAILKKSHEAGLPAHNISPCQGQLLQILAKMVQASRILEVGTLGGYSTVWLARSLPENGTVVTVEADKHHATVARGNLKLAGVLDHVRLLEGDAKAVLAKLSEHNTDPFDLVFIDADKPNNPVYLDLALQLARPGTVIIGDNVVRKGEVVDSKTTDPKVKGMQMYCRKLRSAKLLSTCIQTVGIKGYDGFAVSIVQ